MVGIYRIWDHSAGTVYKYGISSGILGKFGTLARLHMQVRRLNKLNPRRYTGKILSTHPNRQLGLYYESIHTAIFKESNPLNKIPDGMTRPNGEFPFGY